MHHHHHCSRGRFFALGLSLLAASACASQPGEGIERTSPTQPPTAEAATPEGAAVEGVEVTTYAMAGIPHEAAMTEAVLDPRGEVALTLDADGGVRLWTELRSADAPGPLALPVHEPVWMSIAQAEDGYVVAFIDTSGGSEVGKVQLEGETARYVPLYEVPVTDPMFELHVLDGGRRILALGIDHRLRLYDQAGEARAMLDERSFVPWQLRVAQHADRPPTILAVLAGPTRVQPIELSEDRLRIVGEPRRVALDRGPNRNDMALSPDGETVAALRRSKARGKKFTLELIDVATDQRRIIAGEVDTRVRPRLHLVDAERALLESGSGQGLWVDLKGGEPWTPGKVKDELKEAVEALELQALVATPLAASDEQTRVRASIVRGLRVVPTAEALVADPIDEEQHLWLGTRPLRARAVALDPTGERVAWAADEAIYLESLAEGARPRALPGPAVRVSALAFVSSDRLAVVSNEGVVSLRDGQGQELARKRVGLDWGLRMSRFHRGEGGGAFGMLPGRPQSAIRALGVSASGFGELVDVPRHKRGEWFDLGRLKAGEVGPKLREVGFAAVAADEVDRIAADVVGRHYVASEGEHPQLYQVSSDGQVAPMELRRGEVLEVVPDPTGGRLAVVQHSHRAGRLGGASGQAVSVYDASTRARLWTRETVGSTRIGWSGDGGRLAIGHARGGLVVEAESGVQLLQRRDLGLVVEPRPDAG